MAGLIPQTFIDDLLARADIVDVVERRMTLRKSGRNYSALCPFHREKSPSFSVDPDKQFYYCFGCGAGGNAIGFIMNHDHVEFPRAVEILAGENGMEVPRTSDAKTERRQAAQQPLLDILAEANRYFQTQLRQHPARQQAIDYLKGRGLSGEMARRFQIGFAPPGWDGLLRTLGTTPERARLLEKAGLLVTRENRKSAEESPYYDRFRHRIQFPIRDGRGQVIGFGGRVLGDDKPKYLNSPETPVFHKGRGLYGLYEARQSGEKFDHYLVVEGYMDVIALAQAGIHNAVATLGTACTDAHLNRLFRLTNTVVFCFDGDTAGRNAAWRALQTALPVLEDGRSVRFLFLPDGDDPDTLVRRVGADAWRHQVAGAEALDDVLFRTLATGLDLNRSSDAARFAAQARPLIDLLPRGVFAELLRERLARTLGLSRDQVNGLANAPAAQDPGLGAPPDIAPGLPPLPAPGSPAPPSRRTPIPRARRSRPWILSAIQLVLHQPSVALGLGRDLGPLLDGTGEAGRLLLELVDLVNQDPNISSYALVGHCYGSPVGTQLTQLLNGEQITPHEGIRKELEQMLDRALEDARQKAERAKIDQRLAQLKARLGTGNGLSEV